jgi:hypothetical protein
MNDLLRQLSLKTPADCFQKACPIAVDQVIRRHQRGTAIGIILLFAFAMISLGCDEVAKGPSAAELAAQKQAAAEKQRADAERARRELEESRRHESDAAAQRFSMAAVIGWAMVTLFIGLVAGMSLGLRTRADYAKQSRQRDDQASARPGP